MKGTIAVAFAGLLLTVAGSVQAKQFLGTYTTNVIPGRHGCRILKSKDVEMMESGILRNLAAGKQDLEVHASQFQQTVIYQLQKKGFNAVVGYRPGVHLAGNSHDLVAVFTFEGVAIDLRCSHPQLR